jgi:hypothetical protein
MESEAMPMTPAAEGKNTGGTVAPLLVWTAQPNPANTLGLVGQFQQVRDWIAWLESDQNLYIYNMKFKKRARIGPNTSRWSLSPDCLTYYTTSSQLSLFRLANFETEIGQSAQ